MLTFFLDDIVTDLVFNVECDCDIQRAGPLEQLQNSRFFTEILSYLITASFILYCYQYIIIMLINDDPLLFN